MKHRHFPRYNDDADFTTNAPSYYEDLARKEKLIRLLAERIWGYEEILDETLEQIQERFRAWDKNLEDFPEDVKVLLQQWLDDGTLDHIINETIFNWKLDTSIFEQFRDSVTAQLQQNTLKLDTLFINIKAIGGHSTTEDGYEDFDNTDVFKLAEQLIGNQTGTIYIPEGTYLGDFDFFTKEGIRVMGAGIDKTILKNIATVNYNHGFFILTENSYLSDLTLDGSGTELANNNLPVTGDGSFCLETRGDNITVERVRLINAYNKQMIVQPSSGVKILDCEFIGNEDGSRNQDGIHFYAELVGTEISDVTVKGCLFKNHSRSGMLLEHYCVNFLIEENTFLHGNDFYATGIVAQWFSDELTIINNTFDGQGYAIYLRDGFGSGVISNNIFRNIVSHCLYVGKGFYTAFGYPKPRLIGKKVGAETYFVFCRSLIFEKNTISFNRRGLTSEATSAVVFINGFDDVPGDYKFYFGNIFIKNNTLLKTDQPKNFVVTAIKERNIFENLMIEDNTAVDVELKTILQGTADNVHIKNNYFDKITTKMTLTARKLLKIYDNHFSNMAVGYTGLSTVFYVSAPRVEMLNNFFDEQSNITARIDAPDVVGLPNASFMIKNNWFGIEPVTMFLKTNRQIPLLDIATSNNPSSGAGETFYIWVDLLGSLRISKTIPQAYSDGVSVGSQS